MKFRELPAGVLPRSDALGRGAGDAGPSSSRAAVERWRGATMNKGAIAPEPGPIRPGRDEAPETSSKAALDQAHGRLLRRALEPSGPESAPKADLRTANALWRSQ